MNVSEIPLEHCAYFEARQFNGFKADSGAFTMNARVPSSTPIF